MQKVKPKYTGTVTLYLRNRDYGFIRPDDGEVDVFVHYDDLQMTGIMSLRKGDRVAFDVRQDGKKTRAVNVEVS
ncbi:cold-shock protein [Paenibacillus contaminans]|uniref:Cold-shock protein n=2 Tax=Paenibacillus contaminans TaxID=450362 RepID=A0A329MLG0_9BACL|nr:cold-shock protein [Paenibacillus contaminans]